MMGRALTATVAALLTACAAHTGPDQRLQNELFLELYWEAARACEGRYLTLSIDRVDPDGALTLRAAQDSRSELAAYAACYHDGIRARVERRKQAGLPVPESANLRPEVDID